MTTINAKTEPRLGSPKIFEIEIVSDTENIWFGENNLVSISIIDEDMINLVISKIKRKFLDKLLV